MPTSKRRTESSFFRMRSATSRTPERTVRRIEVRSLLIGLRRVTYSPITPSGFSRSGVVREFALFGETTGETDEYGLPVRYPWAEDYRGKPAVVYGHTPVETPRWKNNTLDIDTGCVFGGRLSALRWPEREVVSVPARRIYVKREGIFGLPPAR